MSLKDLRALYSYYQVKRNNKSTFSFNYKMYYLGTENAVIFENELINHYLYIEGDTITECYKQLGSYMRGRYYNGKLSKRVD